MNKMVLASRNPDKIEELQQTLSDLGIELLSALDFDELNEVEEDRVTLEGNALKKAAYVHRQTGLPALADDTGLEVEALGGRPGVYSARYAGEGATYDDNVDKLLEELSGVEATSRGARFRTVVAFVTEEGEHTFEGVCPGSIISERRGGGGFGYDPVFLPEGFERTFAQLEPAEKNRISHRGRAISKFYDWLTE
ncbi:MAG: RdgB/HAM1 family non-canonical purine NTP pyrophosphatase, partial [Balneolaceae bacterium]